MCQVLSFSPLADAVRRSGKADSHHGQRCRLTVMFYDLAQWNSVSERMERRESSGLAEDISQQLESLCGLPVDRG